MVWDLPSRCPRTPFVRAQALGAAVTDLSRGDSGSLAHNGLRSMLELAQELCVSERTLARHIRAATGRSQPDLLQGIRIHRAQALLKSTLQSTPRQIRHNDDF